jgi:hypothetical protein
MPDHVMFASSSSKGGARDEGLGSEDPAISCPRIPTLKRYVSRCVCHGVRVTIFLCVSPDLDGKKKVKKTSRQQRHQLPFAQGLKCAHLDGNRGTKNETMCPETKICFHDMFHDMFVY